MLSCALPINSLQKWARCPISQQDMLCTAEGYTWQSPQRYNKLSGCALMREKGLQHISFVGDSYMRHIFAATVLTFTGDYEKGALLPHVTGCRFDQQFEEKDCRQHLTDVVETCEGTLRLKYIDMYSLSGWTSSDPAELKTCAASHLLLLSSGNHPVDLDYTARTGVNSIVHTRKDLLTSVCPVLSNNASCNTWWLSTHQRLNNFGSSLDEEHDVILYYNAGMRRFFEDGRCGQMHFVDVFNMTNELVGMNESVDLTYDGGHWGMTVNLLKVQIMLADIAKLL